MQTVAATPPASDSADHAGCTPRARRRPTRVPRKFVDHPRRRLVSHGRCASLAPRRSSTGSFDSSSPRLRPRNRGTTEAWTPPSPPPPLPHRGLSMPAVAAAPPTADSAGPAGSTPGTRRTPARNREVFNHPVAALMTDRLGATASSKTFHDGCFLAPGPPVPVGAGSDSGAASSDGAKVLHSPGNSGLAGCTRGTQRTPTKAPQGRRPFGRRLDPHPGGGGDADGHW